MSLEALSSLARFVLFCIHVAVALRTCSVSLHEEKHRGTAHSDLRDKGQGLPSLVRRDVGSSRRPWVTV